MCSKSASWIMAASMLGALAACGRNEAAKDLADELDKALDPAPQYVDRPAEEPRDPK
jgi:hypothetical protein